MTTVQSFSLHLQPDNTTVMSKTFPVHPTKGFDGGKKFKSEAGKRVSAFLQEQQRNNTHSNLKTTVNSQFDTWVVPLVQMFPFGIRQDEFITSELLSSATQDSKLYLASGYFNLTRKYMDILLKSSAKYEILTAHPTVNGFYEAKGVAGKYSCHPCLKKNNNNNNNCQNIILRKQPTFGDATTGFPTK